MKGLLGWLLQRISGVLLIVGLIIHFSIMHYSGPEQIKYELVLRRISSPYWKTFDLLFLSLIIYHGFNGVWGIAIEYISSKKLLRFSRVLILTLALLLFAIGIYILSLH